jgi:hypothetical protein
MIKYYGPNPKIIAHIEHICNDKTKVLELGPGLTPFSKATHFCGWDQGSQKIDSNQHTVCDFSIQKLPYADKEFDFIYCRHVLEDLYNPFLLVEEMSRVGKAVKSLASSISKLYEGKNIKELAARGLQLDACCLGLDACRLHLESL